MDKSQYNNSSGQWRKCNGTRRSSARRRASLRLRLVFVTVAAIAALATQSAISIQHTDRIPDIGVSNWFGSKPEPITGVASVIDGDTIEVHGQRIRFNGIDAPESKQYCSDSKGFDYPCGRALSRGLGRFSSGLQAGALHLRDLGPISPFCR